MLGVEGDHTVCDSLCSSIPKKFVERVQGTPHAPRPTPHAPRPSYLSRAHKTVIEFVLFIVSTQAPMRLVVVVLVLAVPLVSIALHS